MCIFSNLPVTRDLAKISITKPMLRTQKDWEWSLLQFSNQTLIFKTSHIYSLTAFKVKIKVFTDIMDFEIHIYLLVIQYNTHFYQIVNFPQQEFTNYGNEIHLIITW